MHDCIWYEIFLQNTGSKSTKEMISWNLEPPAQCNYFNRNVEMLISTQYIVFLLMAYLPPLLFQCQEFVQDSFVGLSVSVHGGGWNKIKIVYLKIGSIYDILCHTVTMTSFFLQIWVAGSKSPKYYLSTASVQRYWLLTIPRPPHLNCTILV